MRLYSVYQQAIFDDVANGEGHTVVLARAGSGKTTTIVEALTHVPASKSVLLVAFNKSIATELSTRVPCGVEVSTLHSLGYKALLRSFGKLRVDSKRVDGILTARFGDTRETWERRRNLAKVVSLAKATLSTTDLEIDNLIDSFGVDVDARDRGAFCRDVLTTLEACKEVNGAIDFDDMIWLPVVLGSKIPQFDRVFVDETQDLNAAQLELALRACKKNGRICAVGDDRQAIYGFRGADSNAVGRIVERLSAKVLPLSVCYRCGSSIVNLARETVPDFEPAPNAPEGTVTYGFEFEMMRKEAKPGDFILSRANAPLVSLCLGFIAEGIAANIQGRDIGANLTAFVKKAKCKTVSDLIDYVESWRSTEIERLLKKVPPFDTQATEDKADCILTLCEGAITIDDVLTRIESLFADTDSHSRIILSTTHKAKGLERDRVFVLNYTYRRRPGKEEDNLYYVACTRARQHLFLVVDKVT